MAPLTPAWLLSGTRQGSSLHALNLPTIPSPTTPRRTDCSTCFPQSAVPSRWPAGHPTHSGRATPTSVGLPHSLAGSPRRRAESSSSSYGLVVHLLMLSTSPRGDAVSFGCEAQVRPRRGLAPRWFSTLAIALAAVSDRRVFGLPPGAWRRRSRGFHPGLGGGDPAVSTRGSAEAVPRVAIRLSPGKPGAEATGHRVHAASPPAIPRAGRTPTRPDSVAGTFLACRGYTALHDRPAIL